MVEKVTKSLSKSKDDDIEVMQMWGLTIISFSAQKFWVNFDFCPSPLKMLDSITILASITVCPKQWPKRKFILQYEYMFKENSGENEENINHEILLDLKAHLEGWN